MAQRVLIVEDVDRIAQELATLFKNAGWEVAHIAHSGVQALEYLRQHGSSIDLVSLDVVMPEMDGVECFKHLRKDHPNLRCFFITYIANEPKGREVLAKVVPSELICHKNLTLDELKNKVQYVLSLPPGGKIPLPAEESGAA